MIHSLQIKTDPLTVCLSGIFNVTDRWVITMSQSWQAVETKKWRCGTRGWTTGGGQEMPVCVLLKTGQREHEVKMNFAPCHPISYPNTDNFMPKFTFPSVFVPWNSNTLPYSSEDQMLFVVVTSHNNRCTWNFKPIVTSFFFWIIPSVPPILQDFHFLLQCDIKCNTRDKKKFTFSSFSFFRLQILRALHTDKSRHTLSDK